MASNKNRNDMQAYTYHSNDAQISDSALIEVRRQEMEEHILPNHQTILNLSKGKTAIIKSKEVKLWEE